MVRPKVTMPPRRKKKSPLSEVGAESLQAAPAAKREMPRFRMVSYADGSLRAVRCQRRTTREREQALADWMGAAPGLSSAAHVRSMDSLLYEVLDGLKLEEATLAPEVLAAAWQRAAGPDIASHAELLSVSGGKACIRVGHPLVRMELMRLKPQILRVLNAELGEGSVKMVSIK